MVNITKKILVMASAAMAFAGLASAQAVCALPAPVVKIIRAEGTSELLSQLVIECKNSLTAATVATTGSVNLSLPGATITSKVLDASAGKTEVVAVVSAGLGAGVQVFGSVTAGNIVFNGLQFPVLADGHVTPTTFTITVSNIRVSGGLAAGVGSIPVISVNGYIVSANATSVPLTLLTGGQYAYIQNGLAAPTSLPAYATAAGAGYGFTAGAVGTLTGTQTLGQKNNFSTCNSYYPAKDAYNLVDSATAVPVLSGSSLAFVVRVSANFTGAFKAKGATVGSGEQSDVLVTSGLNTNAVANGTRFQISFPTQPAGVSIYVPTSIITSNAVGNTIQLTSSAAGTAFAAATPSTSSDVWNGVSATVGTTSIPAGSNALALVSGTAVFEVITADGTTPVFDIPVFIVAKANTVAVGSTLSATVGFSPNGSTAIPNFTAGTATVGGGTFSACSTSLLFPFVSNQLGFDVGIVIANTSSDPTNLLKLNQSGNCSLNFYGAGAPATAASTGAVAAGQVYAALLSGVAPGFQGYMVAKCDFQFAHGYAYINYGLGTSAGVTSGYLAQVLPTSRANGNESLGN